MNWVLCEYSHKTSKSLSLLKVDQLRLLDFEELILDFLHLLLQAVAQFLGRIHVCICLLQPLSVHESKSFSQMLLLILSYADLLIPGPAAKLPFCPQLAIERPSLLMLLSYWMRSSMLKAVCRLVLWIVSCDSDRPWPPIQEACKAVSITL